MSGDRSYYEILEVPPDANFSEIKEAYIYLANIFHPDRMARMPEKIRYKAEEKLKRINEAYTVLSKLETRRQYDARLFGGATGSDIEKSMKAIKPKVEVYPKVINFKSVLPYVKQKDVFFVRNVGGSFKKVMISKTPEWLRVVETKSLQRNKKLPMQVQIEAIGIQWNTTYSSQILVRLDGSEAKVTVRLRVRGKPRKFLFW